MRNIRNFSIIAHIDHGKSTLSDRLIQACNNLKEHKITNQMLDSMDLERERGITIKAQCVTLSYKSINNQIYQLNLIDTPGHVDFSYEVSRSLAACEGAILVIDAGQGVAAQTLANCYTAIEMDLEIVLILNKIDLPTADPNRVLQEIENIIGISAKNAIQCSAKTGFGISDVLEGLVRDIPPPKGDPAAPLQALIIDSWFNNYLGVISLICIKNGILKKGDKIRVMNNGQLYIAERLGIFTPKFIDREILKCGEIGWLVCAIKDIHGAPVGATLTTAHYSANEMLPGFKKIKPQVYASLFPVSSDDHEAFRNALDKLSLNDASLFYEPENSPALGFGFRCGFLGLLHMEIIHERLEREYNLVLITTAPTVIYEILTKNKKIIYIDNLHKFPHVNDIVEIREPIAECHILLPRIYLGSVINLCIEKRGTQTKIDYYGNQVSLVYDIPMSEIILDFFDRLKSISRGYSSLDYCFKRFQRSDMVRINILINGEQIDVLTLITHRDNALRRSRKFINKLQELIPRQQFNIVIQATIGNNVIARSTVKQLYKNVLAKCYGGDVSRKKKLLQKQKKGKERMKEIGNVKLPQEVFLAVLHMDKDNK